MDTGPYTGYIMSGVNLVDYVKYIYIIYIGYNVANAVPFLWTYIHIKWHREIFV